ncbi:MAG: short-chain dehydrogenase [Mesorhizobium sp.]|nr:MAG: short-chain dehydrogenase [Mesorhizobium sp.]
MAAVVKLDDEDEQKAVEMCLSQGLYSFIDESPNLKTPVRWHLQSGDLKFDAYCIYCKKITPFKTRRAPDYQNLLGKASQVLTDGSFPCIFICQREPAHKYTYLFRATSATRTHKIGQWPSMETIAASDIEKYRNVLEPEYFSELHRAGGLFSHGIGVGAFVYLRRIFERLIARHHADLPEPIEGFATMRMDEKIDALKSVLPAPLVENKAAYGILSKGMHELDEDTCRKHFPVVRAAIIAILEEDLQAREKKKAADALRIAIAAAAGEVKSKA